MPVLEEKQIYKGTSKFDTCNLIITVVLKTYETLDKFYDIDYQWQYKDDDIINHPLYHDKDFIANNNDGEIIAQNELSDKLIEFLVMDDEKLQQKSGNTHVKQYRSLIIKTISLFWD